MEGFEMSLIWNIQGGVSEDGGSHGLLAQNTPAYPTEHHVQFFIHTGCSRNILVTRFSEWRQTTFI